MGWHGDSIGLGIGQQHWLGHRNRRRSCNKFNGDNHDDEDWVYRWLGNRHGDVAACCIDSSVWGHDIDGQWFHCSDQ